MSQNDNNSEISIYNPDFCHQFLIQIIFDKDEKEAFSYLNGPNTNFVKQFCKVRQDINDYKEWLDSEENAVAKQYFTNWFARVDCSAVLSKINEDKKHLEQIRDMKVTPLLG